MNIDANVQKIIFSLLRKWKLLVVFALLGALLAGVYTANFTTLTYSSSVTFLAYSIDSDNEINDTSSTSSEYVRTSNTSKMNYAMKMLDTYIKIMQTNEFDADVVTQLNKRLNSNYPLSIVHNSMRIEPFDKTAMFVITVTTTDPTLSYEIAHQLETSVPKMMQTKNSGLVRASVEDKPIKASSAVSLGYPKKCIIGAAAGVLIAAAYVILRNLLDVRVRTSDELVERYDIPILGAIPNFESKNSKKQGVEKNAK